MRAIQLVSYNDPINGIKAVDLPEPAPPVNGQVLLEVSFAPINNSDLLLANGAYALHPELPSVIGNEGVGTVIKVGPDVSHLKTGDRVIIPAGTFAWARRVIAPADNLFALSPDIPLHQAAMLGINPPTAVLMLEEYVALEAGDWVILNAANSGVGRSVIAAAKSRFLRVVAVVRRPEQATEMLALGADIAMLETDELASVGVAAVESGRLKLALDGVAGNSTALLAKALSNGGTLVCYAAASKKPLQIELSDLVSKRIQVHGFFMYFPEFLPKLGAAIRQGAKLVSDGKLRLPVAAVYTPENIGNALEAAIAGKKVLLSFQD